MRAYFFAQIYARGRICRGRYIRGSEYVERRIYADRYIRGGAYIYGRRISRNGRDSSGSQTASNRRVPPIIVSTTYCVWDSNWRINNCLYNIHSTPIPYSTQQAYPSVSATVVSTATVNVIRIREQDTGYVISA